MSKSDSDGSERAEALRQALDLLECEDRGAATWELAEAAAAFRLWSDREVRLKTLADRLDVIEAAAAALADEIETYHDDLTWALGSDAHRLDSPYLLLGDAAEPRELRALSLRAGQVRGHVVSEHGSGDPDHPDRGGPSLTVRQLGTAKRCFVAMLVGLWARHRADALSDHGEGLCARFVALVWHWATSAATGPKGLADDLKAVLPPIRLRTLLRHRAWRLQLLAVNLRKLGCDKEAARMESRARRIQCSRWLVQDVWLPRPVAVVEV